MTEQERDQAVHDTFMSPVGLAVLEDMFLAYGGPSYSTSVQDPALYMAFREGQRSVLLGIQASIRRIIQNGPAEDGATIEEVLGYGTGRRASNGTERARSSSGQRTSTTGDNGPGFDIWAS